MWRELGILNLESDVTLASGCHLLVSTDKQKQFQLWLGEGESGEEEVGDGWDRREKTKQ